MRRALLIILAILMLMTFTSAYAIDLSQFSISNIADEPTIPQGAYGVMEIPLLECSIPLYCGDNAQSIVDKRQSAYYGNYSNGHCILDHYGQDGLSVTKCRMNDGLWIYYANGEWIYAKCIAIQKARTDGDHYDDMQGNEIVIGKTDYLVACCTEVDSTADVIIAIFREY